jgi:hypothetical protein
VWDLRRFELHLFHRSSRHRTSERAGPYYAAETPRDIICKWRLATIVDHHSRGSTMRHLAVYSALCLAVLTALPAEAQTRSVAILAS